MKDETKPKGYYDYVDYDHDRREAIVIGDHVTACDEWGYWRDDIAAHSGIITWHSGWLTRIERADGTAFIADGHTTRLVLA